MSDLSDRPDRLLPPSSNPHGPYALQLSAAMALASMAEFYVRLGIDAYAETRLRAICDQHGWAVNGTVRLEWPETKTAPGGFRAPEEVGNGREEATMVARGLLRGASLDLAVVREVR